MPAKAVMLAAYGFAKCELWVQPSDLKLPLGLVLKPHDVGGRRAFIQFFVCFLFQHYSMIIRAEDRNKRGNNLISIF